MFAAVAPEDTVKEVESMAAKVLKMKMWPDDAGGTVCQIYLSGSPREIEGATDMPLVEAKCTGYQWGGIVWYVRPA